MKISTNSKNPLLPPGSAEIEFEDFRRLSTAEISSVAAEHRFRSEQMIYLVVPSHVAGVIESHRIVDLDGVVYAKQDGQHKVGKDRGGILAMHHGPRPEVLAVRRIMEEKQHLAEMLEQVEKLKRLWADSSGLHKPSLLKREAEKLPEELSLTGVHEGLLFVILAQNGTDAELRKIENRLTDRQGEIEAFLAGN